MAFPLTCPHCRRTSIGQILYIGMPEVDYNLKDDLFITITGECMDCGQQVQIIEHAIIDKIEVEV